MRGGGRLGGGRGRERAEGRGRAAGEAVQSCCGGARGSRRRGRIVLGRGPRAAPRCAPAPPRPAPVPASASARGAADPEETRASAPAGQRAGRPGRPGAPGTCCFLLPNSHLFGNVWMKNSENKSLNNKTLLRGCAQCFSRVDPQDPFSSTLMKSSQFHAI